MGRPSVSMNGPDFMAEIIPQEPQFGRKSRFSRDSLVDKAKHVVSLPKLTRQTICSISRYPQTQRGFEQRIVNRSLWVVLANGGQGSRGRQMCPSTGHRRISMNRNLMFGIAAFLTIVAVALVGGENEASGRLFRRGGCGGCAGVPDPCPPPAPAPPTCGGCAGSKCGGALLAHLKDKHAARKAARAARKAARDCCGAPEPDPCPPPAPAPCCEAPAPAPEPCCAAPAASARAMLRRSCPSTGTRAVLW